eukprot:2608574-Pyramimonas_sp.AAC.1
MVTDTFVSFRGALANALVTQVCAMGQVVSLQRVQAPTNIQVRRLSAIARVTGLPEEDRLPGDEPTRRGRLTWRFRISTLEWRRRRRRRRL